MPTSRMARAVASGGRAIRIPHASSRSALPHWLEIERLPCFATCTPAPATTNAAMVEMLNVLQPSPPVPQVSSSVCPVQAGVDRRGHVPHGAREAHQFVHRLALHLERDQEGGDLRVAGLAAQDDLHGGFGIGGGQIFFGRPGACRYGRSDMIY